MNTTNQPRNLLGGHEMWSKMMPNYSWAMFILGWFTVPIEILLRRDFGERYLTRPNFFAGLIVLGTSVLLGSVFSSFSGAFSQDIPTENFVTIGTIIKIYLVLGVVHFATIAYKDAVGRPTHSFSSGRSWLTPIGAIVAYGLNKLLSVLVEKGIKIVPAQEREILLNSRPYIRDVRTFTERYIEPFFLFVLIIIFIFSRNREIVNWLLISTFALIIYNAMRHQAERGYVLDIRDQMIEANFLREMMSGQVPARKSTESMPLNRMIIETASAVEKDPELLGVIENQQPSLGEAIAAMNARRKKAIADPLPEAESPIGLN